MSSQSHPLQRTDHSSMLYLSVSMGILMAAAELIWPVIF